MRRLILAAMIAGLLAPVGLHAQKVYKENGKVILDLTVEAGMPAGVVTSESKTAFYGVFSPDNNAWGTIDGKTNNREHPLSATVYRKLEVSLTEPSGTYTWADGFNYCKNRTEAGSSDWRLPTQRELILMYIFKPALEDILQDVNGTTFSQSDYWSATEGSYNYVDRSQFVNLNNGRTNNSLKSNMYRVRCVREL